jgi:hypothetical protein
MINFCIVIIIITILLIFSKSQCCTNIKNKCRGIVTECMFNEDKLFKHTMYGTGYRIGYDKCNESKK